MVSTEYRWYLSHLDSKIPVSALPPLWQAQVWCDETCKEVPDLLDAEQDARPGEFDEAFSLWTAPTATEPQRRVPTNKLRAYLYQAIAKERSTRPSSRPRPDLPSWNTSAEPGGTPQPQWKRQLLQGKAQRPLRRTMLLARQGMFITPLLYASLTGPQEEAFPDFAPCPQCQGAPAYPAHVFFDCPAFASIRAAFEADVIRCTARLIAPAWSTVQNVIQEWQAIMTRFPSITKNHAATAKPQQTSPNTGRPRGVRPAHRPRRTC